MKTVLLVEDDLSLAEGLSLLLKSKGYRVKHVTDGQVALEEAEKVMFDLILLDIRLPVLDGISVCRQLRERGDTTPILFLTARDDTRQKVEGLLAGGDDYLTKPFETEELLARMQGIFRRNSWLLAQKTESNIYEFSGRSVNFKKFEARGPYGTFKLSRKECMIIKYLVERQGQVVSRDQLLDAVWGYDDFPTSRTVDNFILRIRKIFEANPKKPKFIETIRGTGYRLNPSPKK